MWAEDGTLARFLVCTRALRGRQLRVFRHKSLRKMEVPLWNNKYSSQLKYEVFEVEVKVTRKGGPHFVKHLRSEVLELVGHLREIKGTGSALYRKDVGSDDQVAMTSNKALSRPRVPLAILDL